MTDEKTKQNHKECYKALKSMYSWAGSIETENKLLVVVECRYIF